MPKQKPRSHPPTTIFGEEVKKGDEILYMYKSDGVGIQFCYGKVTKIHWKADSFYTYQHFTVHVHKTFELNGYKKGPCDMKVYLTNPTILKVGTTIHMPTDTIIEGTS